MTELPEHGRFARATTYGCHCNICRTMLTRYKKKWRLEKLRGVQHVVPAEAAHRKIHALNAIGHTNVDIAAEMGFSRPQSITNILARQKILTATNAAIEQVFRRMEMRIAEETPLSLRCRRRAAKLGWLPPLAYDDIDEGIVAEVEKRPKVPRWRFDTDEIDYMMQNGIWDHRLSRPEKIEALRRWEASGRSQAELCRLTGWKESRYRSTTTNEEAA